MPHKKTEVDGLNANDVEALVVRAVLEASGPVVEAAREIRRALRAQAGIYDAAGLAELLGVAPQTLRKWQRLQGLPCHRVGGARGRAVYLLEEVVTWLQHMPEGTGDARG